MNFTAEELAEIICGTASAELRMRFADEIKNPDSQLHASLKNAAAWSQAKLKAKPVSTTAPPATEDVYRVVRKAAFWDGQRNPNSAVTQAEDLLSYVRGSAEPEAIARIRAALQNPQSEILRAIDELLSHED